MDTKERILQTALSLYNRRGIHSITSRHIAAELGISPGNLHYHFKHTEDIIEGLYQELSGHFDVLMSSMETTTEMNLERLTNFIDQSLELSYTYRFIFLHMVEIGLRIPTIRNQYYAMTQRREKEFLTLFQRSKASGIFRDDIPDAVWVSLVTQIFIVGDFWLSNNEMTRRLKGNKAIAHYREVILHLFVPYLRKGVPSF